jgi:hypothetical protein
MKLNHTKGWKSSIEKKIITKLSQAIKNISLVVAENQFEYNLSNPQIKNKEEDYEEIKSFPSKSLYLPEKLKAKQVTKHEYDVCH